MPIDYEGRVFRPVGNSPNGEVNSATEFRYCQNGDLLTATYAGGGIRLGQMVGLVRADQSLWFAYQHLSDAGELRSGTCESTPELLPDGRVRLHERWRWTSGDRSAGESTIEEVHLPGGAMPAASIANVA